MEVKKEYNLTNPQKSIWLTEQHYINTNVGNIVGILNFEDAINLNNLKLAVNLLVSKNDALRIGFHIEDGYVKQYIQEFKKFDIEILNIQNEKEYIKDFSKIKFDITRDNLYHFEIIKQKNKIQLISRFHHIVTDAWSLSLIISEIVDIYNKIETNEIESLDEYYSYINYIESEKDYLNSDKYFKDQNYWNYIYSTEPQILTLNKVSNKNIAEANRLENELDSAISELINRYCKENSISIYCFFLTCLQIYVSKNYRQDDIVIGNPFLNRRNHKERTSIGMYVNTLPVRLKMEHEETIEELLKQNNSIIRNTLKHEKYPYNDILEYVKNKYNINQNLYNILFSFQNAQDNRKESDIKYTTDWIFNNNIADNLEIHIHDRDDNGTFNIVYDYQTNVFNDFEMQKMNKSYINIMKQVLNNKAILVKDIELINEDEKRKIICEYNNTNVDFSKEFEFKNVYNFILNNSKKNLNNIALEDERNQITYKELFERVDKLAHYLKEKYKIQENENIGILTDKNIDTIIGILAVLKINCTIVPIDSNYPISRKEYMISNAEIKTILFTTETKDLELENKIDIRYENYKDGDKDTNTYNYDLNNNLYIVYTSGSTGEPKAVTITHKNIINLIIHEIKSKKIIFGNSKILQFATLSFDVSYQEIFTAFFTNSTLVMIEDKLKKDNKKLTNYIIEKNINVLFIPPRYLIYLSDNDKFQDLTNTLKHIITAGEQLIITPNIEKMITKGVVIHNHYGPAETHVATTYTIDKDNIMIKPPIGKPISNAKIYILDKNRNLCPIGVVGEIYISGECVGNGYYNKSNLTKERFITDNFNTKYKMYKTGDLGKYDYDGNIYYLGRTDFQVKINGFRIEIEEIEKQIASIPYIKNIAILIEKDALEKNKLVAYLELNEKIEYEQLKINMTEKLPQYMIPTKVYLIDNMPLNINGKADKKLLEENKNKYKIFTTTIKNSLPENEIEAKILKCIQKVLNTKEVNVENDFFEIGGDSLSAIELQLELSRENILLNTQEIYDNPTARKIYQHLKDNHEEAKNELYQKIELIQKEIVIKEKNNILLTGATGYLGIHILNELLENTKNNIYCLIRKKQGVNATERLLSKYKYYFNKDITKLLEKRVYIFTGDLIQDNLGVNKQNYIKLLENIDIVINVAASVKHYGKRDYNYEHNVISTKNIIQFSVESGALLNHISTVGIAGNNLVNTNNCIKNDFSEEDLLIGQDYKDNVYISTKLEAEQLIIKEIKNDEIKANILRVGNLMNRYSDNMFQDNKETNAFQNKLKEIVKSGYIPEDMESFTFDLTPVDFCAKAIIKLIFYEKYNNIYHVLNNKEIGVNDIKKILNSLGIKTNILKDVENINILESKWLINDFTIKNKKKIQINSLKTQKILKQLGFHWENDMNYYNKVFKSILEGENNETITKKTV
ncbi:MAG: amino acid adenylation domain-containing protein [Clostridia bacterium]|nr:amino acid adenylation domain-containing protein [Clostridia bacterium]